MELILFIATILNLISVGLNIYSYIRYTKLINDITDRIVYPEYYKDVWIYYYLPGESEELIKMAWLAVNDNGEYIWTRSDNKQIIPDDWVTKWEYIK